jgi:hypothetical protein
VDQYLYRLFRADGTLLYAGVSDDWTRRLRQHWLGKEWAPEILSVTLETYPSRAAVLAAECKAIRGEDPLYNIQHKHARVPEEPADLLSVGDILLIAALIVAAGFVIYELSQAAIEKHRAWKADREDFRAWQCTRDAEQNDPVEDGKPLMAADVITPTAVTRPVSLPSGSLDSMAFAALYANLYRPASGNCTSSIPSPTRPEDGTTAPAQ